jgi:hypothetical protein
MTMQQIIDHNYNVIVRDEQGNEYLMYANRLHSEQLDYWKGWKCNAGSDYILIDSELNVYGAQCENDFLGVLFQDFKLLDQPTTCKLERCTNCTDDLLTIKSAK